MRTALTTLALGIVGISLANACGDEEPSDTTDPSATVSPQPTDVTPTVTPNPSVSPVNTMPGPGVTPVQPVQPGTTTPTNPSSPVSPTIPPTGPGGTDTPTTDDATGPVDETNDMTATTDTTTADETDAADATDDQTAPTGGEPDAGDGTEPGPEPGPVEPPPGAYVACSGDPIPELTLTPVITNVTMPIQMVTPKSDPNTAFVIERAGKVLRFDLSQDSPTGTELVALQGSNSQSLSVANECGFLGIALHPNFDGEAEKRMYLSYMPSCPANIFGAGGSSALDVYEVNGDSATFVENVFSIEQPEGNHNGGSVMFGPDGYLYYGLGDGGGSNDQHGDNGNGQNPNTPLGSILRFDVDNLSQPPLGNLTSDDVGGASVDGRIIHFGLRNPWRFSFDRFTGDLYIGDVGQSAREEISFVAADSGPTNFGWAAREGTIACGECGASIVAGSTATEPIFDYASDGTGFAGYQRSVTGGFVYRGSKIPGLWGRYIFGDYVQGDTFAITYNSQGGACDVEENPLGEITGNSLVSFAQDANGELYAVNMSRGIYRIDPAE